MKYLFIIIISAITFIACNDHDTRPPAKYEEKKASLSSMEQDSPIKFLKVTGSVRGNLMGQTVVEGDISNNATLVTYKNIQLQLSFKDDNGKTIDKQKYVVDDVVKPGASVDYKLKVKHVKGVSAVSVQVMDAEIEK